MKRIIVLMSVLLVMHAAGNAQISFFFVPEIYGRNVDGLVALQVQNLSSTTVMGRILITVTETSSRKNVLKVLVPQAEYPAGISSLSKLVYNKSSFSFAANALGALANQTRSFPPGEYSFCFTFLPGKGMADGEETCFNGEVQPLVPLTLITPAYLDTICDKRPVLSWQPPMPYSAGMRFRLMLVEKTKATAVESMLSNRPLLLLDNISAMSLLYPASQAELQEGKTYCWQVIAYEKGVIISRSEIWEFTVQCKEEVPPVPFDSYRELKLMQNGNYYIANYYFKFAFRNDYNIDKLSYEVMDVSKGMEKVKRIPEVRIQSGINRIAIDLSDSELTPGKEYVLKVYPFNEPAVQVRFIYQQQAEK